MTDKQAQIRLALRVEGDFWNAYLALPHTMEGAKLIGSILIGPVYKDPLLKEGFMILMSTIMNRAIKDITGGEPEFVEVSTAPESERSGSA